VVAVRVRGAGVGVRLRPVCRGAMIRELEKARGVKQRLQRGDLVIGAQIELADAAVVEILGRAGCDVLIVDAEHCAHGPENVQAMLQAGVSTNAVVLARTSRLDQDLIRLYLDLGSPGVLCPFIESADQARLLVAACQYPPAGIRGYGPRRAGVYGFDAAEYFASANDSMLCIPLIESEAAIRQIDEIVAVPGIDVVCIGPVDLSISLGVFQQYHSDQYAQAEATVRDACRRHGKAMGTGAYSPEHAIASRDAGDQFLLALSDDQALREYASATLATLRPAT
jgi:2-keto-3-deoxy-L-rhamnonate aldolase RhmA